MKISPALLALVALLCPSALFVTAACGPPTGPDVRIEVERNVFSYEGEFAGVGGGEAIHWEVSGSRALIEWDGTEVTAGEMALTLHDASGAEVYFGRAVAGPPPTVASSAGVAGEWLIEISYQRLRGTVAVRGTAVTDKRAP